MASPVTADVGLEEDIKALIAAAEDKFGPVDVFFSNAGLSRKGQETASDADWDVSWRVHVMSHVFAARALVPGMLARGSGYLLNTASAAGLLASLNSMPYGVTKNAAVALAEHLAIQYGDRGIRVSVLCPQSVQTGMTTPGPSAARVDGVLQPPEVARMVIEAMEAERFLILSHPQVARIHAAQGVQPRPLARPACGGCATRSTARRSQSERLWREIGCRADPGVVLHARRRVGAAPRRREFQASQRLGLLYRGRHAVDDGHAEFLRQFLREIGHAGTAQHDRLRALVERAGNLGFEFLLRARARLFEIEHRDVARRDLRPLRKAIAAHQFLQRHDRARQRGDDRDAFCNLPSGDQRRLANADHREARRRSRGIEPGVIETGDNRCIGIRRADERLDQAGNGKGLVIISFDRDRAHRGRHGGYFGARARRRPARRRRSFRSSIRSCSD